MTLGSLQARLLLSAGILAMFTGAAAAQNVFNDPTSDRIDDLNDQIEDDAERDLNRFDSANRQLGFYGSVSGRVGVQDGNTESTDIGIGANFGTYDGTNGHDVSLSYIYSKDEVRDNVALDEANRDEQNDLLATYTYSRDFGASPVFGFGEVQLAYDQDGSPEQDHYLGVGIGYRVFAEADRQLTVQAGPGYRYLDFGDGAVAAGDDDDDQYADEFAFKASANYTQRLSPTAILTDDFDVLTSDSNTAFYNDLAVSVSMTDALSLRTSLLTEYNTQPRAGYDYTDHTLTASVVYTFN